MVSLPSERSGVPARRRSIAASIWGRSSLVIGGLPGDTGAGVAAGDLLQGVSALGAPVSQRSGDERAGDLGAQPGGVGTEICDVGVGAGHVGAGRVAPVQAGVARRWPSGAAGVAQGLGRVVVAGQESARVVVDLQCGVGEQGADLPGGQEHALEPGAGGMGGLELAVGGGAGDGLAVVEAVAELAEVVGRGAGGLDVQDAGQAVAGAPAVAFAGGDGAQVAVLDGQGDPAAGQAGDVPGDGAAEPAEGDRAVGVGGDRLGVQAVPPGVVVDPDDEAGAAVVGGLGGDHLAAAAAVPVRAR